MRFTRDDVSKSVKSETRDHIAESQREKATTRSLRLFEVG